ncbi:MAG: hypothetical protein WAL51_12400, partial [Candidatus Acidiferrales bacterium]
LMVLEHAEDVLIVNSIPLLATGAVTALDSAMLEGLATMSCASDPVGCAIAVGAAAVVLAATNFAVGYFDYKYIEGMPYIP